MSSFVRKHALPIIACIAALISAFFVPPNEAYLDYFDFKTLGSLFCILATVNALVSTGLFSRLAVRIVKTLKTQRACVVALVIITLIGAMFITNDMALLTFLPLSYAVLRSTGGKHDILAWCFILQNAAAVLGGMILPFGNPHNLYLYSLFEIPTGTFILTMLPTFLASLILIGACCLLVKPIALEVPEVPDAKTGLQQNTSCKLPIKVQLIIYGLLFALTLGTILRAIPYYITLSVVLITLLIVNRHALARVDYGLLITFSAFFIFAGNMSNIPQVKDFLVSMLQTNAILTIAASCQVISNLPTTLLLAPFTCDWATLLVVTDIGGMGTPIASLASLITIKTYLTYRPGRGGYFMKRFLLVGFCFLVVLCIVAALFLP